MKISKNKIIGVFLLLALIVIGLLFFNSNESRVTVTSLNGDFTISFSPDSLSDDTTVSDIVITDITTNIEGITGANGQNIVQQALSLEPSGTTFTKPVTFSWRYTPSADDVLLSAILHSGDFGTEYINDLVIVDNKDGSVSMSGEITHFSDLIRIDHPFQVFLRQADEMVPGETKSLRIRIGKENRYSAFYIREREHIYQTFDFNQAKQSMDSTWTVKPFDVMLATGEDFTPTTQTVAGGTYTESDTIYSSLERNVPFTCTNEEGGRDTVRIPNGIKIELTFETENPVPQFEENLVEGSTSQYLMEIDAKFNRGNTNFFLLCKEKPERVRVTAPKIEGKIRLEGGIFGEEGVDLGEF